MKLFIGVPVYSQVNTYFFKSMIDLIKSPPVEFVLRIQHGDSLVTRARNAIAHEFLKTDCSHLLFIDSDILFTPGDVERICLRPELPILAGCCPLKKPGPAKYVSNIFSYDGKPDADGYVRADYVGTGFMRISRECFLEVAKLCYAFETDYDKSRTETEFFGVGVVNRRYLSEDWLFCHLAARMNLPVYLDPKIVVRHAGEAVYPIQV